MKVFPMVTHTDPWVYTAEDILNHYHRLETSSDLDPLMERIGESKYVLLGEASHGTHEYYTWRSALSKRLIKEKGFSFIAVEGDWPDCYRINRFVKGYADAGLNVVNVLKGFRRWPTWMWGNWEIGALVKWLREHNEDVPDPWKVGFYGLDVYSLWESLGSMIEFLQKEDPDMAMLVRRAMSCFEPYGQEGAAYAQALRQKPSGCTEEVISLLTAIRKKAPYYDGDREAILNTTMNARVVANAERYYRSMVAFEDRSWNIRDQHMATTLDSLMQFYGTDAKAIVWAHNTHVGDARATDMRTEGLLNIGQLVRERHKQDGVVTVGFGSYRGSVIAGRRWGGEMQKMIMPPAIKGSVEEMFHRDSTENKLLIFTDELLKERFDRWLPQRAIGVAYRPENDPGYYVPTRLSSRYDAFLYIERTQALHPLHTAHDEAQTPDTYPFGF